MKYKKFHLIILILIFLFFVGMASRQRIHLLVIYIDIIRNYSELLTYIPKEKTCEYVEIDFDYVIDYAKFCNSFGNIHKKDQITNGSIKLETAIADLVFLRPVYLNNFEAPFEEHIDMVWTPKNGKLTLGKLENYKEFDKKWIEDQISYEIEVLHTQPKPIVKVVFLNLSDLAQYIYRLQWKICLLKDHRDFFFLKTPNVNARIAVKDESHFMGKNVVEILLNDHTQQISQTIFVKGRDRLPIDEIKKFVSSFQYLLPALYPTGENETGAGTLFDKKKIEDSEKN